MTDIRHFLDLSDAGGDGIAAMIGDALERKAARRDWPKGRSDPDRPLDAQGDALWWGGPSFSLSQPYAGFSRVIRGFERSHPGLVLDEFTATVDGGAGNGGTLIAASFEPQGALADRVDVR